MSTIAEKLKTTYLGLAGLTTSMRQLLSVGAKEVTSQEINSKLDGVAQESTSQEILNEVSGIKDSIGTPTLTIPDTTAEQELAPNVVYVFAERTSDLLLSLGEPIVGKANEYHFFIEVGATSPTITFPIGIEWNGGNAPTIAADKTYEVSILNNIAAYFEV